MVIGINSGGGSGREDEEWPAVIAVLQERFLPLGVEDLIHAAPRSGSAFPGSGDPVAQGPGAKVAMRPPVPARKILLPVFALPHT